jgi:hypothetical protein
MNERFDSMRRYFFNEAVSINREVKEFKQTAKKIENAQKFIVDQYGEKYLSNPKELDQILEDKIDIIRDELKQISSAEHKAEEFLKIKAEREKVGSQMLSFEETVDVFTQTNYLVDDFKKEKPKPKVEPFKIHTMYDIETGKGYKAKTKADHEKFQKLGYVHEKPEKKKVVRRKKKDTILEGLNEDLEAVKLSIEFEADETMLDLLQIDLEAVELAIELHIPE